jgi:hypothetical protein
MSRHREISAYLAGRAHVNGRADSFPSSHRAIRVAGTRTAARYPGDSSLCEIGKFPGSGSHASGQSGWHPLGVTPAGSPRRAHRAVGPFECSTLLARNGGGGGEAPVGTAPGHGQKADSGLER